MIETFQPLLSIAIPTYNRANFLERNLTQLFSEIEKIPDASIEILVSDNCSTDKTEIIVKNFISNKKKISYIRNNENIGWGKNFLQCFQLSKGKFVHLLGDDDFYTTNSLSQIYKELNRHDFGVMYLKPYGFEKEIDLEKPNNKGKLKKYNDTTKFLLDINSIFRLLSACIITKDKIKNIDIDNIVPGNFAHLQLIIPAILSSKSNIFYDKYTIASKRNNSIGYNFSEIFVDEYWKLIMEFQSKGLDHSTIKKLKKNMLLSYYPYYILKERASKKYDKILTKKYFDNIFSSCFIYKLWVRPTITLPFPIAFVWGILTTFIGRLANGDFNKGYQFIKSKLNI